MKAAASARSDEPAARVAELAGRFTPAARQRIRDYLDSFVSFEPMLGLLYSTANGRASWSLVAFAKPTVDELVRMYGQFGAVVCYDIDGFRAVVPQVAHVDSLDAGMLDFVGNRLVRSVAKESS